MPCVGFEPTIATSGQGKTVHALDRSTTVTDYKIYTVYETLKFFPSVRSWIGSLVRKHARDLLRNGSVSTEYRCYKPTRLESHFVHYKCHMT
jgi:hypothetical protein